jgi:predicted HicB family RNase H-like nuclease
VLADGARFQRFKVINTRDVIAFDGRTVDELQTMFQAVIDKYLSDCVQLGKDPAKPVSGRFNLRIDPTPHQQLALSAERQGLSLISLVEQTLTKSLVHRAHTNPRSPLRGRGIL